MMKEEKKMEGINKIQKLSILESDVVLFRVILHEVVVE
jgi:hypothetical protein